VKKPAILACLIPVAAFAQMAPEDMMSQALQSLSLAEKVSVVTTGAEVRGSRLVNIRIVIGYQQRLAEGLVRIEILSFEDGKLASRQAGDGTNLWDFDVRSNSYSSSAYSTSEHGLSRDWKQRFFHTLRLRTSGVTAFTFRLLDDAFGTGPKNNQWLPWIPISTVSRSGNNVVCVSGSPSHNDTTYSLSGNDDEGYTLNGAAFSLFDSSGQRVVKNWDTTVTTGNLPEGTQFGFTPPKGARANAIDQRSGGV